MNEIRALGPGDAEAWFLLRREMLLAAPLSFAASPEDDRGSSLEAVRELLAKAPEHVVFGAFAGAPEPALVGAVGCYRESRLKQAHRAALWGMYVREAYRGRGLGAGLVAAALAHARTLAGVEQLVLSVSETAPAARRMYERAGFVCWGTEPGALRHASVTADEHHMTLRLLVAPE
ncbi:MAG: GNAT family N-acetyltransferase [Deltaproteobacteria bacterium]|nr:GNAT family N-acetyltransferase [Deltaproteobacteria bacterium]